MSSHTPLISYFYYIPVNFISTMFINCRKNILQTTSTLMQVVIEFKRCLHCTINYHFIGFSLLNRVSLLELLQNSPPNNNIHV